MPTDETFRLILAVYSFVSTLSQSHCIHFPHPQKKLWSLNFFLNCMQLVFRATYVVSLSLSHKALSSGIHMQLKIKVHQIKRPFNWFKLFHSNFVLLITTSKAIECCMEINFQHLKPNFLYHWTAVLGLLCGRRLIHVLPCLPSPLNAASWSWNRTHALTTWKKCPLHDMTTVSWYFVWWNFALGAGDIIYSWTETSINSKARVKRQKSSWKQHPRADQPSIRDA